MHLHNDDLMRDYSFFKDEMMTFAIRFPIRTREAIRLEQGEYHVDTRFYLFGASSGIELLPLTAQRYYEVN